MPTTEVLDIWRSSALPLMVAGTLTFGMILVSGSMVVAWVRKAISAT